MCISRSNVFAIFSKRSVLVVSPQLCGHRVYGVKRTDVCLYGVYKAQRYVLGMRTVSVARLLCARTETEMVSCARVCVRLFISLYRVLLTIVRTLTASPAVAFSVLPELVYFIYFDVCIGTRYIGLF